MTDKEKQRMVLVNKLGPQFLKDLRASLEGFSNVEQVQILESLIETANRLESGDDFEDVYNDCIHPILIKYKSKSTELFNRKLMDYFAQESLKLLDLIYDEKADDNQEQFLTDDEYARFMRVAKNVMTSMRQITYLEMTEDNSVEVPIDNTKNKEYTARRRALFIHYLDKKFRFNIKGDKKPLAEVTHFLTGNSVDNLYKYLRTPLDIAKGEQRVSSEKYLRDDLNFVKGYFERLELTEIVKMIDKDLKSF